jgi:hypothetical protein
MLINFFNLGELFELCYDFLPHIKKRYREKDFNNFGGFYESASKRRQRIE